MTRPKHLIRGDSEPQPGDTIAVWFSCGAASAAAAYYTIKRYGDRCNIRVLNNPVLEEDADNRRFATDVARWLGVCVERVQNPDYLSASARDVWAQRRFMSGPAGAPCTLKLKKEARQCWENHNPHDWLVLGFTLDEKQRYERFVMTERTNLLPVLIDEGLKKDDCYRVVMKAGIKLPRMYHLGYPNANCVGCVKASSPTYWNHVRQQHPDVFRERARQSRELGAKLVRVNNKRIYLDELDPNAKGRPMKSMDFECGIFCEET